MEALLHQTLGFVLGEITQRYIRPELLANSVLELNEMFSEIQREGNIQQQQVY